MIIDAVHCLLYSFLNICN